MAGDIILGVGVRFNPADIDTQAIRDAVAKAMANFQIKLAKVKIDPAAAKDAMKDVEFVLGRNNFRVSNKAINSIHNAIQQGLNQNPFNITLNAGSLRSQISQVLQNMGMGGGAGGGLPQLGASPTAKEAKGTMTNAAMKLRRIRQEIEQQTQQADIFSQPTAQELSKLGRPRQATGSPVGLGGAKTSPAVAEAKRMQELDIANKAVIASQAQLNAVVKQGGADFEVIGARVGQITERFATYLVALKAIFVAQQLFSTAVTDIISFDNALMDLQKVLKTTPENLSAITKEMYAVAQATGKSVEEVGASVGDFVRQGKDIEQAMSAAKNAMILANISELNVHEATSALTTAMQVFGDELKTDTNAMDIMSTIADKSASTTTQLAQSLIRSGAAAEAVGITYRQLNAMTAAVIETTQLSGDTVGSAFKTIFATLAGVRQQLMQTANGWGANIQATDDQFTVLTKLSQIYKVLDIEQKSQLSNLLGGKRRFTELNALLNNFNKTQDLMAKSLDSAGSAASKNEVQLSKLSVQAQNIATSFSQLVVVLSGTDKGAQGVDTLRGTLSDILTTVNSLIKGATSFIQSFSPKGINLTPLLDFFVGAAKGGLLVIGPAVLKQMWSGLSQFIQLGKIFNSLMMTVGGTMSKNVVIADKQVVVEKDINAQLDRRSKTLMEHARIMGIIASKKPASAGLANPADQAATVKGQMKLAGGMLVMGVIDTVVGKMSVMSKELQALGGTANQTAAKLMDAGGSALKLGGMIGLMAGPIAGVVTGLVTFAASLVKSAALMIYNNAKDNRLATYLDDLTMTFDHAVADGKYTEAAFKKLAENLNGGGNKTVNAILVMNQAWADATSKTSDIAMAIKSINEKYAELDTMIEGTIRSNEIKQAIKDFTESFRSKGMEFKLQLQTGTVDSAFAPIIANLATMQSKLQDINALQKTGLTTYQQIAKAEEVTLALQNNRSKTTATILSEYQMQSDEYKNLITSQNEVNKSIAEQQGRLDSANETLKQMEGDKERIVFLEKQIANASGDTTSAADKIADYSREIKQIKVNQVRATELQRQAEEGIGKLLQERTKIEGELTKEAEKQAKKILDIQKAYEAFIASLGLAVLQTQAETAAIGEKTKLITAESAARIKLMEEEARGGSAQVVLARKLEAVQIGINAKIEERLQQEKNTVDAIYKERDKAASEFNAKEAARLDALGKTAEEALALKREAVTKQLKIEASVEVKKITIDAVLAAEDALRDKRLADIQLVAEQEARNAQAKIDIIKQFSQTGEGLKFLQKEMGNVSQWAERMYGKMGARQVEVFDAAAKKSTQAVAERLSALPSNISDEARLKALLEARAQLVEINEKNITEKRTLLLERVQEATDRVNQAEEQYVAERNKLPALYAKEVESMRNLATAEQGQDDANKALMAAYKAAGDASADYAFGLMKTAFDVRQATGSLSANQAIAQLNGMFATMVSNSQASGQKLIEIRSQIAQEEMSIMQSQFNSLKSLGVQAATSVGDDFNKMVQGLRTAAAIQSGADVGKFSADQLSGALNFKDLFGGLENKIAEFGLSKLGIDPGILKNTENQMITLSQEIAATGKLQVDAANNQVLAAQQQVLVADQARQVALEQLKNDQANIGYQQQQIAYAAQNVAFMQRGFADLSLRVGNELTELGKQTAVGIEGNALLSTISTDIKDTNTRIQDLVTKFGAIGSAVTPGSMAAIYGGAGAATPGAAKGTLTHMEMNSLAAAARREKGLMPPGSRLMMANTSEVVLTRKQAQKIGLKPLIQLNAAAGNAAGDPTLTATANALNNSIQTLMNKLNSPGFVQQNINVQVDTERNVNVRGLDAVNDAMKNAFENKVKGSVTQEEHKAISDLVTSLAERLSELGIVNSRGV